MKKVIEFNSEYHINSKFTSQISLIIKEKYID